MLGALGVALVLASALRADTPAASPLTRLDLPDAWEARFWAVASESVDNCQRRDDRDILTRRQCSGFVRDERPVFNTLDP